MGRWPSRVHRAAARARSEEHTSELQSQSNLVCRLLLDKKHNNGQTVSPARWALVGEACRLTDPLYSPGRDLISTYDALIADCLLTRDQKELKSKIRSYA